MSFYYAEMKRTKKTLNVGFYIDYSVGLDLTN